ncbi:hypothetical protein Lade_2124 [Legionella adelaidensis]|uniref:Coiled-coil protein n=1 Tax=Legionella adelaidensis TaxID=45056 RepID=A0A0W0R1F5_9GAMM|nr:hypothetical protein [Legionella adelaidensis]KTC64830.1 hypothetical protein Lade_2124 [Legionella adelaidensis]
MTIFLKVAQKFLGIEISALHDRSLKDDASIFNTVATAAGYGRDIDLATEKRALLKVLIVRLSELKDGENDAATLGQIKGLIESCRREGAEKSSAKHMDEGHFGPGLRELEIFVQVVLDKISSLGLQNIPADSSPLSIFHYAIAQHGVDKALQQAKAGCIQRFFSDPRLSSTRALEEQKEKLLLQILADCIQDIDVLNLTHPRYGVALQRSILLWIREAKEKIAELEGGTLKDTCLKDYLEEAETTIRDIPQAAAQAEVRGRAASLQLA